MRTPEEIAREERAVRRLMESAATQGPPAPPGPFLIARIRAAAATRRLEHPFGLAAWRMLPILALLVACLTGWASYESLQARKAQREAFQRSLASGSGAGDLVLASLLAGGGAP
jgi:hypothetical protein